MYNEQLLENQYGELEYYEKFNKAVDYIENDFSDKFLRSAEGLKLEVNYNGTAIVEIVGELRLLDMVDLVNLEAKATATLKHYIEVGIETIKLSGNNRYHFEIDFPMARRLEINLCYKNIKWKLLQEFEEMVYEYIQSLVQIYKNDIELMMEDPYIFDRQ